MALIRIGKVISYYPKVKTAIIELTNNVMIGDILEFCKQDKVLFKQKIESIQLDYSKVDSAGKDDIIGIVVGSELENDVEVFKNQEI